MTAPIRDALAPVEAYRPSMGATCSDCILARSAFGSPASFASRIAVEAQWLLHLAASVPHLGRFPFAGVCPRPRRTAGQGNRMRMRPRPSDHRGEDHSRRQGPLSTTCVISSARQCAGEASLELVTSDVQSEDINKSELRRDVARGARRAVQDARNSNQRAAAVRSALRRKRRCSHEPTDSRRAPRRSARNSRTPLRG